MALHTSQEPATAETLVEAFSGEDVTNVNRSAVVGLGTQTANENHAADGATPFGASEQNWRRREKLFASLKKFTIDVTRARCMTEVFHTTEGEPQSIRMAQGVARTLAEMPLLIDDDDLFAGNLTSHMMGSHLYPELVPDYYLADWEALGRSANPVHIAKDDIALLEEIAPYWRGKTIFDRWDELRPQDDEVRNQHGLYFNYNMLAGVGHLIANVPLVLERGLAGLRSDAVASLHDYKHSTETPDPERVAFFESVIISLDGVIHYAQRHARAFEKLADDAEDPARRVQLSRIAKACAHVPEHPARNSFEALQSTLMVLFGIAAESSQISICPGRVDQWLAPFVENELAAGETPGQIVEWLEGFILKLSNWRTYAGEISSELCTITIGGKHVDGSDATTVVTELVMRAYNHMRLATPPLALRIHAGTPRHVWDGAILCLSNGCGMPSFMNDEVMILALGDLGFTEHDAHNYADIGCVEMGSAGTSLGPVSIGFINIAKCFEIAINDGKSLLTDEQLGPQTGTLEDQATFEDVLAAYEVQLSFAVDRFVASVSALEQAHSELRPVPFLSALTDNALAEGRDLVHGSSKYRYAGLEGIGYAEVADSLTAIKHFVFDNPTLTPGELLEHLRGDFKDDPNVRLMLRNRAPKYGNDDDVADDIARTVAHGFVRELKLHRDYWDNEYIAGAWSIALAMKLGFNVAALPNGRSAHETLTEGIRPASGCDRNGPTSTVRSVAKLDHREYQNGSIFNMTVTPSMLDGETNRRKFADIISTFFRMGGFQMQFNVMDAAVLRDAQAHPELYRDLIVRVAGYCAYFVEQTPRVQDQIIERTAHGNA